MHLHRYILKPHSQMCFCFLLLCFSVRLFSSRLLSLGHLGRMCLSCGLCLLPPYFVRDCLLGPQFWKGHKTVLKCTDCTSFDYFLIHFLSYFLLFLLFYLLFKYFWPFHVAYGVLAPRPGVKPLPPTLEVWSLNRWTTSDFLGLPLRWRAPVEAAPVLSTVSAFPTATKKWP